MSKVRRTTGPSRDTERIDPSPEVIAGLVFAGVAAVGTATTALMHVRNRIDATRARKKAARSKLAKWGHVVKTLATELRSTREFLHRVQPESNGTPVVGSSLELSKSDVLVYRESVARLTKLAKDGTRLSLELTEALTGEAERRAWYASRKLGQLADELPTLVEEQKREMKAAWGARTVQDVLAAAERATATLSKFEVDLVASLDE